MQQLKGNVTSNTLNLFLINVKNVNGCLLKERHGEPILFFNKGKNY